MINNTPQRENFGSKIGIIMASAGSAIGLGNIWKFPYEAGKNGGAAFIIVYLGAIMLVGFSIMIAEYVIGRRGGRNIIGSFKVLAPKSYWWTMGIWGLIAAVAILSFYGLVAGWTLEYLFQASRNMFVGQSSEELKEQFSLFVQHPLRPIFWQVLFMVMTCLMIISGVKNGIERYSRILMPILFVTIVILAIRSVTLPGASAGVEFIFKPDFSVITGHTILNALGLAFFSLSLGMGTIITYGSYVSKNDSLISTSLQVIILDTLIAILAGLAIFPAVFAYGIEPDSGPSLVFITLPNIFQQMPGGMVWGILFFLLLAVAALTSSVSLLEVVAAYISEELKVKRSTATICSTIFITIIGVFCSLSQGVWSEFKIVGLNLFDFLDVLTSSYLLPIGGVIISLFVGWRMPKADFIDELQSGANVKIYVINLLRFILRYIAPAAILFVFLSKIGIIYNV